MIPDRFPRDAIDQKANVPPGEFFVPDTIVEEQAEAEFENLINDLGPEDALVVTHNDADGLTSGAYMADWYESVTDGDAAVYPTSYHGPCGVTDALKMVNEQGFAAPGHVFITDLGASQFEAAQPEIKALYPDTEVSWIDHHQWSDSELSDLRTCAHGVIDESVCATQLVVDLRNDSNPERFPLESDGVPAEQEELAEVVNDLDMWIKEDPRSDRVGVFAEYADDEVFMNAALDGVSMLDSYDDEITSYEEESKALRERGVRTATFETIAGLDVAFTYGYGPSSLVGNDLVEEEGADMAVIMRPDSSLSFYAHSDEEGFTRCHEVAAEFGGGGHPTAAGGQLDIERFDNFYTLWHGEEQAFRSRFRKKIADVVES